MPQSFFQFKQFTVHQDRSAMKVTTDACLFGAWITENLATHQAHEKTDLRIADLGTGTGLLSLMVRQSIVAEIEAIEIDQNAFEQATENFNLSPWKTSLHAVQHDIRSFEPSGSYNIIISNPPFYESELKGPRIEKNIAHHDAGLKLKDLFSQAGRWLKPGGIFFMMGPAKRKQAILQLLQLEKLYPEKIANISPGNHLPASRIFVKCTNVEVEPKTEENITIKGDDNQYTSRFRELLLPYYLR